MDRLVDLCADEATARRVLGLTAGQVDDVRRNAALRTAPTAAARGVYTGVLYEALGLATLPARAASKLLIFSGLWGIVRPGDRIPIYRCSIGVRLPGLGVLGAYWRKHLAEPVADLAGRGVVLDLRSSAYTGAWVPGDNRPCRDGAGGAGADGQRGSRAGRGEPLQQGDKGTARARAAGGRRAATHAVRVDHGPQRPGVPGRDARAPTGGCCGHRPVGPSGLSLDCEYHLVAELLLSRGDGDATEAELVARAGGIDDDIRHVDQPAPVGGRVIRR